MGFIFRVDVFLWFVLIYIVLTSIALYTYITKRNKDNIIWIFLIIFVPYIYAFLYLLKLRKFER